MFNIRELTEKEMSFVVGGTPPVHADGNLYYCRPISATGALSLFESVQYNQSTGDSKLVYSREDPCLGNTVTSLSLDQIKSELPSNFEVNKSLNDLMKDANAVNDSRIDNTFKNLPMPSFTIEADNSGLNENHSSRGSDSLAGMPERTNNGHARGGEVNGGAGGGKVGNVEIEEVQQ